MHKLCVIGLGYIGLPTASVFATHGYKVLGVDTNHQVVNTVEKGETHIAEPGLRTLVQGAIRSGNLVARSEPEEAEAFIIAVPTPLNKDKRVDLDFVERAAERLAPLIRPGNLVVLESTVPPGTTRDRLVPILSKSGLKIGEEVFVAHCPERVLPGRILREIIDNDRIIGGINLRSAKLAQELYRSFVTGEIFLTDATTAEMVKLVENTYRDVNIALVNELAIISEKVGTNVWDVIELANKHPRVQLHKPGPGVGGHCIPVDPWFIVESYPEEANLIRTGREINDRQPRHVVKRIIETTRHIPDPQVTILGVSYKGNVDDTRETPAKMVMALLKERDYRLRIYDPYVSHFEIERSSLKEAITGSDSIVILADHDEFKFLDPNEIGSLMRTKQALDTFHILNREKWLQAGFDVQVLGQGRRQ